MTFRGATEYGAVRYGVAGAPPTDVLALWHKYKEYISSDCIRILQREFPTFQIPAGEETAYAEQYTLYLVEG